MLEYIGYTCAFLAVMSSLAGVMYVISLRSHIRNWLPWRPEYYPPLTVIAPQRGKIDPPNIDAILGQNYPGKWEVIFTTTPDDACLPQLRQYSRTHKNVKIAFAEDAVLLAQTQGIHRCQKNNNIITALQAASLNTEVYVIVDADARPFSDWLNNLIAPLTESNTSLGAVTSARIYIPGKGLASLVQALWIIISDSLMVGKYRYIWGGGLAIPKAVFEKADLLSHINGQGGRSITTDDMNIYTALCEQGYETLFVPHCFVPRLPPQKKENLLDVITFTNRQVLQAWWTAKSIWVFLATIGIRLPMLLCALVVAWWYPLCLLALLSILIDVVMGVMALKAVIDAEPRISVRIIFWAIRSKRNQSGRILEPKIRCYVNFWIVLLPVVTPLVATINTVAVPFLKKMRWGGVEYARRRVLGYTGDFSWRSVEAKQEQMGLRRLHCPKVPTVDS